jgi:enamine deaminase RidA (YjgF/YER057c/UK114 family)
MSGRIEARLKELGITLPEAASPAANYVPYVLTGSLLFVAGQIPFWNGELNHKGTLGVDVDIDAGYAAARVSGLNLIAQAKAALDGDLDRVTRVVKLVGLVASAPDFTDHPKVVNGASDLMAEVFGDAGQHARFAAGAAALPLGCSVEVDGIFEVN